MLVKYTGVYMRFLATLFLSGALVFSVMPVSEAYYSEQFMGDYLLTSYKKKISMDLQGASLVDVLKVLSQQTGMSFVSSEGVSDRTLTLYLEKVPLKDAMDTIFLANNLEYEFYPESNIFIIKEAIVAEVQLITKVYELQYASVPSALIEAEKAGDEEEEEEAPPGGGEEEESEPGIMGAVEAALTEYGSVIEDPRTNSLIVRDLETSFAEIDRVIALLDKPLPKVMIEVEVVDVSKTLSDKIGLYMADGLSMSATLAGATRTTAFPWSFGSTPGQPQLLREFSSTPTDLQFPKSQIGMGYLDFGSLTALFQMLSTDNTTKFLARPKIFTVSGQTAEINLVSNEAITANSTVSTETGTTTITWEIERENIGTMLRVTPQVSVENGEIVMVVEPTVSNAVPDTTFTTNNNIANKVQRRSTRSVVRIKNNETLMIGGLLKKDETEIETKVPILGDIPFLGKLFSHSNKEVEDRELLVFLTPRIVGEKTISSTKTTAYKSIQREQSFGKRNSNIKKALARFE